MTEMLTALTMIEKEKGIKKDFIIEALKTALHHAYKKNYKDDGENVEIIVDEETGEIKVTAIKLVVEELSEDPAEAVGQMLVEDAKKIKKAAKAGMEIGVEIQPRNFGRIAAQTAKQIILQKLREAERDQILKEYEIITNDIITATVERFEKIEHKFSADKPKSIDGKPKFNVVLDIGRAEAMMPPKEQVSYETYRPHDKLKVYVLDVKSTPKGPHITVSRTHPDLVRRLFEREVPEIRDGVVEIKAIAREAGMRTKIAVHSHDADVDPVGTCVGNRGSRVNAIVGELGNEKIDIIRYSEDPAEFISAALSPAKVVDVTIDQMPTGDRGGQASVVVVQSQLSLAIGKEGQNARLAARLTGWRIDIKGDENATEMLPMIRRKKEAIHISDDHKVFSSFADIKLD